MQEDPLAESPASSENGDDAVAGGTPGAAPGAAPGAQQDQPLGNYALDELYDEDDRPTGPIAPRVNAPLEPNRQEEALLPVARGTGEAAPGTNPVDEPSSAQPNASTLEERTRLFWAKLEKDRLDSDVEAARERSLQEATKREQDRLDSDLEAARQQSLQEAEASRTVDNDLARALRESSLIEHPRTQQEEEDFKRAQQESLDYLKELDAQEEAELLKAHQLSMQDVARRPKREEEDCLKAHHNSLKEITDQEARRKQEDAEYQKVREESLQTALEWETRRHGWWSDVDDANITANDTSSVSLPQSATVGNIDDNAGSNISSPTRTEGQIPAVVVPTPQRHPIYGFLQGHWAESTIGSQLTLPPYTTTEDLRLPSSLDPQIAMPPLRSPSPVATIGRLRANAPVEEQRRREARARRTEAPGGQGTAQPDHRAFVMRPIEARSKAFAIQVRYPGPRKRPMVLGGHWEQGTPTPGAIGTITTTQPVAIRPSSRNINMIPPPAPTEATALGRDFDEMYDDDDRRSGVPSTAATGIQEHEGLPANVSDHIQEAPLPNAGERPAMSDVHAISVGNGGETQLDHATLEAKTKEFWDRRDREKLESDFKKAKELSKRERRIEQERDKAELERVLLESRESEERRKLQWEKEHSSQIERAMRLSEAHARDFPDTMRARELIQAKREEEDSRIAMAESLRSEELRLARIGWALDEDDEDDDDTSTIATGLSNMSISNRSLRSHRGVIGHIDDDGGSSIASSTHTVRHRPAVPNGLQYTETHLPIGEPAPAYTSMPDPTHYAVPQTHAPQPTPVQASIPEQVAAPTVVTEFGGRVRTPYIGGPVQQGNDTVSWQSTEYVGKRLPQP
ncbi:hypothetical protein LTR56_020489 [Elasticomyces elasticus]|nr:hypothetical protein LTR56_020489 [Elasticomyces elasticus]KAK3642720.1 hypothetical protein LTR22_015975 [Elasticomyces elasticus]KAK4910171.1 hypothetical protein LTR49_021137 [Elasticomyces elasticus]